jgi:NTP pyrophosphatase (non-canonical NTP hydrolase)
MQTLPQQALQDTAEKLAQKLAQLHSMLTLITGNGRESFEQFSATVRDNYVWSCETMAGECCELADAVNSGLLSGSRA